MSHPNGVRVLSLRTTSAHRVLRIVQFFSVCAQGRPPEMRPLQPPKSERGTGQPKDDQIVPTPFTQGAVARSAGTMLRDEFLVTHVEPGHAPGCRKLE